MRYLCTECNFVYDEALGLEEEYIEPHTSFWEISEDFICPVCHSPKEYFSRIEEEINYAWEDEILSEADLIHFPVVKVDEKKDEIKVFFWKWELHPMVSGHFISTVSLYDEYKELVEQKFFSPWDDCYTTFPLQWLDEFEVVIKCNMHWSFSSWKVLV